MSTVVQLDSGSWRAQVRLKGHTPKGQTFPTKEQAQAWADRYEALLKQRAATSVLDGVVGTTTFAEAYELYVKSPTFQAKAAGTRARERKASDAPIRLIGASYLANIDPAVIQTTFIDARSLETNRLGKPISGDTIRLEKSLISQVFNYSLKRGYVKTNPILAASYDSPKLNTREVRITVEEQTRLFKAAQVYIRSSKRVNSNLIWWLEFVFATGTRPGEAAAIKLDWIDLEKQEITFPRLNHKTRKPRVILINDNLELCTGVSYTHAFNNNSPYLFFSKNKKGYTPYAYYHPWRAICKIAGLGTHVVPHAMRHEFISRLFESTNLSDSQVALLVGDIHALSLQPYKHLRIHTLTQQNNEHASNVAAEFQKHFNKLKTSF